MKAITASEKPQINQRIHQLIKMMHERNTNKDRGREMIQGQIKFGELRSMSKH